MAAQGLGDERDATDRAGLTIWLLRAAWVALPFTVGIAIGDALCDWADAPRVVAAALLWAAWGAGLIATAAPRPLSLTVLRTAAPLSIGVAVLALGRTSALSAALALVVSLSVSVLAGSSVIGEACASGAAYGDERRFPLKVPTPLFFGPLPLALVLVASGLAAGPLLLADGRVAAGVAALVVGLPVAAFFARSLHGLSRRWAVLVPAGLVIVDPFTLADPVLFRRERIAALRRVPAGTMARGTESVDLRLGAVLRSVELRLHEPAELVRSVRRRRGGAVVRTDDLLFAPTGAAALFRAAAERRIALR